MRRKRETPAVRTRSSRSCPSSSSSRPSSRAMPACRVPPTGPKKHTMGRHGWDTAGRRARLPSGLLMGARFEKRRARRPAGRSEDDRRRDRVRRQTHRGNTHCSAAGWRDVHEACLGDGLRAMQTHTRCRPARPPPSGTRDARPPRRECQTRKEKRRTCTRARRAVQQIGRLP